MSGPIILEIQGLLADPRALVTHLVIDPNYPTRLATAAALPSRLDLDDGDLILMSRDEIVALVQRQIAALDDSSLRESAAGSLIEPELVTVRWLCGNGDEHLPCWVIADLRPVRPEVIVYCESGFCPSDPYGVISSDLSSLGMDSQWFIDLEDAFRCALWSGRNPPGHEVK